MTYDSIHLIAADYVVHTNTLYDMIKHGENVNDSIIYTTYRSAPYHLIGFVEDLIPTLPLNKQSTKRFIDVFAKNPAEQKKIDTSFGMIEAATIPVDLSFAVTNHLYPDISTMQSHHQDDTERDRDFLLDYSFQTDTTPSWTRPQEEERLDWPVTEDRPNELNVVRLNGYGMRLC